MAYPSAHGRSRRAKTWLATIASTTSLSLVAFATPALAQDSQPSASQLVSDISDAQSNIDQLNLTIGELREAVNQAIVDLSDARSAAQQAREGAEEARVRLSKSQEAVESAQSDLDEVSRSTYRSRGAAAPVGTANGADAQKDLLERSAYLEREKADKQATLTELEEERTAEANSESLLRQASQLADDRAAEAEDAEAHAQDLLNQNAAELEAALEQRDQAEQELTDSQEDLEKVRPESAGTPDHSPAPEVEDPQPSSSTSDEAEDESEPADDAGDSKVSEDTIEEISDSAVEQAEDSLPGAEVPKPSEDRISEAVNSVRLSEGEFDAEDAADLAKVVGLVAAGLLVVASQGDTDYASLSSDVNGASDEETESLTVDEAEATEESEEAAPETEETAQTEETVASDTATETEPVEQAPAEEAPAEQQAIPATSAPLSGEDHGLGDILPEVSSAEEISNEANSLASDSSREAQIETVIARAESQIGVPYAWGGGDANGPTQGIRDGGVADSHGDYNKVGFDCSGLTIYAFAAAGISLPHYTGYQYQRGQQISPSEAERGDLLFWGPDGNGHVAIYLGDGMMLEAPSSGGVVQKSPVRWSSMSEHAVRLI